MRNSDCGFAGAGGFGAVFGAEERILDRLLARPAVKLILAEEEELPRFLDGLQQLRGLSHPNVVAGLAVGQQPFNDRTLLYAVMERADESLQARLDRAPRMSPEEIRKVLHDVASGLVHLHGKALVHRDIKPGNILKSGDTWKLADLAAAKARR
ncbi:MAG: protein kinase [Planctomycetes bacterium]|nr:protein kinase [Planctomycetota bacterium]